MPKLGSGVTFRLETYILAKYKNINIIIYILNIYITLLGTLYLVEIMVTYTRAHYHRVRILLSKTTRSPQSQPQSLQCTSIIYM